MVESALILTVAIITLIAILDFSQVLFTHQMLVERTRAGLRWGMIHAWDGTGDQIANVVMYGQPATGPGNPYSGLTRANIRVIYDLPTVANPNDTRLKVSIVNFRYRFFTPYLASSLTTYVSVNESAPYLYRD